MLLVIITDMNLGAQGKAPFVGRQKPVYNFQQGRLPGPIVAYDGNPLSALDLKIQVGEQGISVKRLRQVFYG